MTGVPLTGPTHRRRIRLEEKVEKQNNEGKRLKKENWNVEIRFVDEPCDLKSDALQNVVSGMDTNSCTFFIKAITEVLHAGCFSLITLTSF